MRHSPRAVFQVTAELHRDAVVRMAPDPNGDGGRDGLEVEVCDGTGEAPEGRAELGLDDGLVVVDCARLPLPDLASPEARWQIEAALAPVVQNSPAPSA